MTTTYSLKVILSNRIFTVSDNDVNVIGGTAGNEVVRIQSGVSNVNLDANIERIELSNSLSMYQFVSVPGVGLEILNTSGSIIATIPSLNQDAKVAFQNGTAVLKQTGASNFQLGNSAISSGGATTLSNVVIDTTDLPGIQNTATPSQGVIKTLLSNRIFTMSDNDVNVIGGTAGNEVVRIQSGVSNVTLDANIERIELSNSLSMYKFVSVAGTGLEIWSASSPSVKIATIPSLNQSTNVAFQNGTAVLQQTGASTFQLGNSTIVSGTSSSATTLSNVIINTNDVSSVSSTNSGGLTTTISAANLTATATTFSDTFNIAAGTYSGSINGFSVGDKLQFFTGAAITVNSDTNQTDGIQTLTATNGSTGATTTITLTGLTAAQDTGLFNLASFNTVFGAGTISDTTGSTPTTVPLTPVLVLPTVTLTSSATAINEGSSVTYTATLNSAATTALSIPYTLSGTGITTSDFTGLTALTSTIYVPAGATTGTLTLNVANDSKTENTETLSVTLGTVTGMTLGTNIVFTTINDTSLAQAGTYIYNGHSYLLSDAGTWTDAQAQAKSLGGNLVTISDQAEQNWIISTFGTPPVNLWIGYTDQETEGVFKWISGETSTFTNWNLATSEPNNGGGIGGNEDYATLRADWNGLWNDIPNSLSGWTPMRGIIELGASVGNTDTVVPIATVPATISYPEKSLAGVVLATVTATDNVGVTGFQISTGNANNFFQIDNVGKISLTTAGATSVVNNFALNPNSSTLGVRAVDAAGNKSAEVNVILNETQVASTFVDQKFSGRIDSFLTGEAYTVTLTAGRAYQITLSGYNGANQLTLFDPYIKSIIDPSFHTIISNLNQDNVPDDFMSTSETYTFTAQQSGIYLVGVGATALSGNIGTYELLIHGN